jgi:hypothetical protein
VGTSVPSTGVVNPLFSRSQRQVTSGEYMGIADEEETHQGDL